MLQFVYIRVCEVYKYQCLKIKKKIRIRFILPLALSSPPSNPYHREWVMYTIRYMPYSHYNTSYQGSRSVQRDARAHQIGPPGTTSSTCMVLDEFHNSPISSLIVKKIGLWVPLSQELTWFNNPLIEVEELKSFIQGTSSATPFYCGVLPTLNCLPIPFS